MQVRSHGHHWRVWSKEKAVSVPSEEELGLEELSLAAVVPLGLRWSWRKPWLGALLRDRRWASESRCGR